jgi:hypothetical protein
MPAVYNRLWNDVSKKEERMSQMKEHIDGMR